MIWNPRSWIREPKILSWDVDWGKLFFVIARRKKADPADASTTENFDVVN